MTEGIYPYGGNEMKIGCYEKRYVYPMGELWVTKVKSLGDIPVRVVFIGEDDEMKYFVNEFGKRLWGVRK